MLRDQGILMLIPLLLFELEREEGGGKKKQTQHTDLDKRDPSKRNERRGVW